MISHPAEGKGEGKRFDGRDFIFWLWEIPLAYVLSRRFGWGPRGVFAAIAIAFSTLAVVSVTIFRRGKWKLKKI